MQIQQLNIYELYLKTMILNKTVINITNNYSTALLFIYKRTYLYKH